MSQIFVADARPVNRFAKHSGIAPLEKLFGEIIITGEVAAEYGLDLPGWIKVIEVQDKTKLSILNLFLGKGEASVTALCLENANSLLIIDEKRVAASPKI